MTTPLAAYMERTGIGDAEFAERLGKDRSLVNRIRRGDVRPTLEVAALIEALSGGEIPMQAWITPADADASAGKAGDFSPAKDAA